MGTILARDLLILSLKLMLDTMADMEDIADITILARDLLILSLKLMLDTMAVMVDMEDIADITILARDLLIQNPKLMPDISTEAMVDMEDIEGMVDMVDMDVSGDKRLSDKHKTWQEFNMDSKINK